MQNTILAEAVSLHLASQLEAEIGETVADQVRPYGWIEYFEETQGPFAAQTPWPDLHVSTIITREQYDEITKRVDALGLEIDAEILTEQRRLFEIQRQLNRQDFYKSIDENKIEDIARWFIQRDSEHSVLVESQVAYFSRSDRQNLIVNGELIPDVDSCDFWDISTNFYSDMSEISTNLLIPGPLRHEVAFLIANHYFKMGGT